MKEDQNNWIVGFRKEFACDCGEEDCLKLEHQDERIISWIKSNMVSKAEMRGLIEAEMKTYNAKDSGESWAYTALGDLQSKLNEN